LPVDDRVDVEIAQAVAPDRVGEVGRHDRVGRERVRVADVRDV
jgi:hypothetical protein